MSPTHSAFDKVIFDKREEQWEHVRYNIELSLLEIVKRGEPELLHESLRSFFPAHNGHLSDDPHKQAIYEFVACVTLVTRFAIEGGMESEPAYSLSDAYIKSADQTSNTEGIHALYGKLLIDFATRVKRAKSAQRKLSLPIIRCIEFIDSNLHNRITLDMLGHAVGRVPAYLSVQFKKETGIPLSNYINEQKIEEAKRLLHNENMTVSAISSILAYSTQGYFAKVFREVTGEPPNQYRKNHFTQHQIDL
jgi:YesN/AraC family two-component response regulator